MSKTYKDIYQTKINKVIEDKFKNRYNACLRKIFINLTQKITNREIYKFTSKEK